jgi:hypothetical protein
MNKSDSIDWKHYTLIHYEIAHKNSVKMRLDAKNEINQIKNYAIKKYAAGKD